MIKPLEGITVLDFSQFLSGPSASLRLADMGAHVIKVEQPGGDITRSMYNSNLVIDGDSSLFHVINRNKDGITINLKAAEERKKIIPLIKNADVLIANFRPTVTKKLGIDADSIFEINPKIIYAEITGYGTEGEWVNKPGQDLLVQSLSGICMTNGDRDQIPTPIGLSAADMLAGQHLTQGILAALIEREKTQKGTTVEVNLLSSIIDLQFEGFTTFLNDGNVLPQRSAYSNANVYTNAPYGIYKTKDWYITVSITPIDSLGKLIGCPDLEKYTDQTTWSTKRDEIKKILTEHLKTQNTQYWLDILEKKDIWCSDVFTWDKLMETEAFKTLDMIQDVQINDKKTMQVLRCPIKIDGAYFKSNKARPKLGQHNSIYL